MNLKENAQYSVLENKMNKYRETIRSIKERYVNWKKVIESDYDLLGLADDVFVSPVKYYFSPEGFGLILSEDILIVSGKNKDAVRREVIRLEKKIIRCSV